MLDGEPIELTRNERRLLELLLSRIDSVLSLGQISASLGLSSEPAAKALVHRTRKKLGASESLIENVHSEGFVMRSAWSQRGKK